MGMRMSRCCASGRKEKMSATFSRVSLSSRANDTGYATGRIRHRPRSVLAAARVRSRRRTLRSSMFIAGCRRNERTASWRRGARQRSRSLTSFVTGRSNSEAALASWMSRWRTLSSFAFSCANRSWALSKATSFTLPMASASGALKVGVGSGLPCLRAGSSDSQAIFVLGVSLRGTLGRSSSAWSVEKSRTRLTGFRHQYFGQTRLNRVGRGDSVVLREIPSGDMSAHAPQGRRASSRSHHSRPRTSPCGDSDHGR